MRNRTIGCGWLIATLLISSCDGNTAAPEPSRAAVVGITAQSTSIVAGETVRLSVSVLDAAGIVLTGRPIAYASSNPAVATVSTDGTVTGVAAGTVVVTATVDEKSAQYSLRVTPRPVAVVTILPDSATLIVGSSRAFIVQLRDAVGTIATDRTVTWGSADSTVARVDRDGLVVAVKAGVTTITATSEGKAASALVRVQPEPIASLSVAPDSATLVEGTSRQLVATLRSASGTVLTDRTVTWFSSDTTHVRVNATGVASAVSTGSALVTATSEGRSASARLAVVPVPLASVSVTPATIPLYVGAVGSLAAVVRNANGAVVSGATIDWSSTDTTIVRVDAAGHVTGTGAGSAQVRATTGGLSGSATVTVSLVPVARVVIVPASVASLVLGDVSSLGVQLLDSAGGQLAGRTITYGSSNLAVATISNTGLISVVGIGQTTFTAASEGATASASYASRPLTVRFVPSPPCAGVVVIGTDCFTNAEIADSASGQAVTAHPVAVSVADPTRANAIVASASDGSPVVIIRGLATGSTSLAATYTGANGLRLQTSQTVRITDQQTVASVEVSPSNPSTPAGSYLQLTAIVRNARGDTLSGKTVSWTSSNRTVYVSPDGGRVYGDSAGATALVTATSEGVSGSTTVTVTRGPVKYVDFLSSAFYGVVLGDVKQLTVSVRDAAGRIVTDRPVTYTSSNPAVATVTSSGEISVLATGRTIFTATSETVSQTYTYDSPGVYIRVGNGGCTYYVMLGYPCTRYARLGYLQGGYTVEPQHPVSRYFVTDTTLVSVANDAPGTGTATFTALKAGSTVLVTQYIGTNGVVFEFREPFTVR